MHHSIPAGAAILLDVIGQTEAPHGYNTVYGNNQGKLSKSLIRMTLDEVVAAQRGWTEEFGSSAAGRYQFMRATLDAPGTVADLKGEMALSGDEFFDAALQDRMGFHLLKRRGYEEFVAETLSVSGFALRLAQEWASFPVLVACKGAHRRVKRGQSYYAGDGVNKALVSPEAVEACLVRVLAAAKGVPAPEAAPSPEPAPTPAKRPRPARPVPVSDAAPAAPPSLGWTDRLRGLFGLAPVAVPILPAARVKGDPVVFGVQQRLVDLGYPEVGNPDGIDGPKTSAALAIFRNEQAPRLPAIPSATAPATRKALDAGTPRAVPAERAGATVATLRAAGSSPIAALDSFRLPGIAAAVLGGVGGADQTGALDTLKSTADQALATAQTLQTLAVGLLAAVQWCVQHWWIFALGGGAYVLWRIAIGALKVLVLFRQGVIGQASR